MTNKEMLDLIMKRLGNRTTIGLRATVLIELNEKIRQLEQSETLPWFLESVWETQALQNLETIDLPEDYLRDDDDGVPEIRDVSITPPQWTKIGKLSYSQLRVKTANALYQIPKYFAVYGDKVYFGPFPDTDYDFRLPYFKRTEPVVEDTSPISNKWLKNFFNFMTLDTIDAVARTHTRDKELVASISADLNVAHALMTTAIEARIHAGREYLLDETEN